MSSPVKRCIPLMRGVGDICGRTAGMRRSMVLGAPVVVRTSRPPRTLGMCAMTLIDESYTMLEYLWPPGGKCQVLFVLARVACL
jgi:hypothetical protein